MRPEKVELYYQQGSSDKVYHLQLEQENEAWFVQAQWGRRGSALQSDTKASNVTYDEARRIYDKLLREKTGKGYQIAQATSGETAISVGLPTTKEHSGHVPELLTLIEEPDALKLAEDPVWWFQQKFDASACCTKRRRQIFWH
jgi:bifunctional non-homologous end joining protein LigD